MISLYFNFDSQIEISMLNGEKLYLLGGRNIQNLCAKKIQQSLVSWAVWNHTVGFWVVSWKLWDPLLWNQLLSQNRDLRPQVPQSSCAKDWKKMMIKFIYSEKATKFCEISTLLLSCVVPVKSKFKTSQNSVTFSEYMNFKDVSDYKLQTQILEGKFWR